MEGQIPKFGVDTEEPPSARNTSNRSEVKVAKYEDLLLEVLKLQKRFMENQVHDKTTSASVSERLHTETK